MFVTFASIFRQIHHAHLIYILATAVEVNLQLEN